MNAAHKHNVNEKASCRLLVSASTYKVLGSCHSCLIRKTAEQTKSMTFSWTHQRIEFTEQTATLKFGEQAIKENHSPDLLIRSGKPQEP